MSRLKRVRKLRTILCKCQQNNFYSKVMIQFQQDCQNILNDFRLICLSFGIFTTIIS
jgi:hypothetical protein